MFRTIVSKSSLPRSARLAIRQSRASTRQFATGPSSTNPNLEKAQEYAKKAYEQASVVGGKAFETGKKYAGPYGEKAQSFLGGYREPLLYNLSVFRELLKQVYIRERLAPPRSLDEITAAYRTLWEKGSSLVWWRAALQNGEWKLVGVYALEGYGIWKIGEIIGRRSLVGYDLK